MSNLPYMKLYWADYLADTSHLSATEHGGYLLLIGHYWRTGSLPDTPEKLARVARMTSRQWRQYGPTLMAFFKDGRHKRIDRELQEAAAKSAVRGNAARKRWETEKTANPLETLGPANANASVLHSKCNDSQISDIRYQKEEYISPASGGSERGVVNLAKEKAKRQKLTYTADFESFYSAYPRKVGKKDAMKAWLVALKSATAEEITAGLTGYPFPDNPKYIPHPATWLNGERWADERAPASTEDLKASFYRRVTEATFENKLLTASEAHFFRTQGFDFSADIVERADLLAHA